jgi:hypothetical protein
MTDEEFFTASKELMEYGAKHGYYQDLCNFAG